MTAAAAADPGRSAFNRAATAVVALLAGLFWLGGMHLFVFLAGRLKSTYDKFQIPGGLPTPTQGAVDFADALGANPILVHCLWVAGLIALLAAAILVRSTRTFRRVGIVAAVCFLAWYALLCGLAFFAYLPIIRSSFTVSS
jgi:hypothetical protein